MTTYRLIFFYALFFTFWLFLINAPAQFRESTDENRSKSKNVQLEEKTAKLENLVFQLTNKSRAENGLPRLEWSEKAAQAAQLHSNNMAAENFFSHIGLDGQRVDRRLDSVGIKNWLGVAENIALNAGYDDPARQAVNAWMKSPSHRGNLLNSRWQETGIGISVAKNGTFYFTQVFVQKY